MFSLKIKNHLHERIILSKSEKYLTHMNVCKNLNLAWKSLGSWKVITLGKVFYEFSFSCYCTL